VYDPVGRHSDVSPDGALLAHYTYGANGSCSSFAGGASTLIGPYGAQGRLTSYGPYTYGYSAVGALNLKPVDHALAARDDRRRQRAVRRASAATGFSRRRPSSWLAVGGAQLELRLLEARTHSHDDRSLGSASEESTGRAQRLVFEPRRTRIDNSDVTLA
jgi:hypothetical protein